jgi:nucleotide-binding universal stress UspA family protein
LLPLDPSPYTEAATEYALYIAKAHDAKVTGLTVLDIPGIDRSEGSVPLGATYYAEQAVEHKEKEAKERIDAVAEAFQQRCEKTQIDFRALSLEGDPMERIEEESKYYDLVIMGLRDSYYFETEEGERKSIRNLLGRAVSPILAVTETFKPIKELLLAYDGSLLAARSLHEAALLSLPLKVKFTLLTSHEDQDKAQGLLDRAEEYLQSYGIKDVDKIWVIEDVVEIIEKDYVQTMDLMALGAHTKKGFFDFMVGDVTEQLINHGGLPLFIGQ